MSLLGDLIREEMRRKGITYTEFASLAKVTHPTIKNVLENEEIKLTFDLLVKISRGLNMDVGVLARMLAPDATHAEPPMLTLTRELFGQLSEEHQGIIIDFIRALQTRENSVKDEGQGGGRKPLKGNKRRHK